MRLFKAFARVRQKFARAFEGAVLAIGLAVTKALIAMGASNVTITPTAPPVGANIIATILGYMQWLGIVGGVGVGSILAGIKIAFEHDMEGGKRALMYSAIGGVIVSVVSAILNLFV
jgi:FtsH-binding integral membrane protein